jgi:hypothetical protein
MKVNIVFDSENQRYKIYNGDTVINANELTINEIPIDSELSAFSANAVENKVVKEAIDANIKVLDTFNARINESINKGSSTIAGNDFNWIWTMNVGTSNNFKLAPNTVCFIAIPNNCDCIVLLNDGYIYDFGSGTATESQVGLFVTDSNITDNDNFTLSIRLYEGGTKDLVEANTTVVKVDYPNELKDIRVDYFGFTHTTAGDSVRSIMETIKTGRVYFNKFLNWAKVLDTIRTLHTIILPAHTDIQVVLPSSCILTYYSGGTELGAVGDFESEETQVWSFNTKDNTDFSFAFSISPSTSVPDYHIKLDDLQLYYELDARFYNIMADKVAKALSEALKTLSEATINNIHNLNNVTNTNIDNLNSVANTGIDNINKSASNALKVIGDNKTVALNDIAKREGVAISNIAEREGKAINNMATQESTLAGNLNTDANNHIKNINALAQQKMAELQNLSYTFLKTVTLSSASTSLISLNDSELDGTNELLIYIDGDINSTGGAIKLTVNEEVLSVNFQTFELHACIRLKKVIVDRGTYWTIEMNSGYSANYLKKYDSLVSLDVSSISLVEYKAGTKVTVLKR